MASAAEKPKRAKKAVQPAAEVTVKSIKGFNQDLTCRGFQFEVGKTYVHAGPVQYCESGFHACDADQHPLSVFQFYPPAGARYCDVTQGGQLSREVGCSKIASATITIGVETTIGELVKRAWDYVWLRATKSDESHVTIESGAASATGWSGAASATGVRGAASATGESGAASATGEHSCASAWGYEGRVLGGREGVTIAAVERDRRTGATLSAAIGIIGRDGLESNVWYACRAGKLVVA